MTVGVRATVGWDAMHSQQPVSGKGPWCLYPCFCPLTLAMSEGTYRGYVFLTVGGGPDCVDSYLIAVRFGTVYLGRYLRELLLEYLA